MNNRSSIIAALSLSILFTFTLFFLTLEIPHYIDEYLRGYFPDIFWMPELRESFLNSVRPIGYLATVIIVILIILSIVSRRVYLSIFGSVALYLPIFGYFAFAMFFLAGIGVLRVLWLPLIEYSPDVLSLGHIVIIPFILAAKLDYQIGYLITELVSLALIFIGLLLFTLGVVAWLYGRFRGIVFINFWIISILDIHSI